MSQDQHDQQPDGLAPDHQEVPQPSEGPSSAADVPADPEFPASQETAADPMDDVDPTGEPTEPLAPPAGQIAGSQGQQHQVPGADDNEEPTQVFHAEAEEPTQVIDPVVQEPVPISASEREAGNESTKFRPPLVDRSLFRPRDEEAEGATAAEATAVMPPAAFADTSGETEEQRREREQREAAAREEEQRRLEDERIRRAEAEAARQRALGTVTPTGDDEPLPSRPPKRTTDKWLASLGLLLFRATLAGILGIRGYQMLTDIPGTRDLLAKLDMPYLEYFPWALGIAHMLAAACLLFGFAVRTVGLCVAALAICVLALVKWGVVPVFQSGMPGFIGELEVLLAASGILLLCLGGGGWGIDAGIRRNRQREKYGD